MHQEVRDALDLRPGRNLLKSVLPEMRRNGASDQHLGRDAQLGGPRLDVLRRRLIVRERDREDFCHDCLLRESRISLASKQTTISGFDAGNAAPERLIVLPPGQRALRRGRLPATEIQTQG